MNPLISVIIPIYNIEKYVRACVKFVISQSYNNLEIILVDDGATDSSPSICDEFAELDSRVVVIHKSNGGLSDARNAGLIAAKGEYISFIDGDDIVHTDYIRLLYETLVESGADMSLCSLEKVTEEFVTRANDKVISDEQYNKIDCFSGIEGIRRMLHDQTYVTYVVAWNKLYKKSLFDNIEFPIGRIHEDEYVTHKVMYRAQKIAYIDCSLYYYIQRETSITGSSFSPKKIDSVIAKELFLDFCIEHSLNELFELAAKRYLYFYYIYVYKYKFQCMNKNNNEDIKYFKTQKKVFKREYKNKKSYLSNRDRVKMGIYTTFPNLYWKYVTHVNKKA